MALELWFHDAFDEGMDTALDSHTPNTGLAWITTTWFQNPNVGATVKAGAGYANLAANDDSAVHRISLAPHNFDYDIIARFRSESVTTLGSAVSICFRGALTGMRGVYQAQLNGNGTNLQLLKTENGIGSVLASVNVTGGWTINTIHKLKVEVRGSTFKVYLDDVLKLTVVDATWSGSGGHNYIGFRLLSTSASAGEQRIYDFEVYADSPDTKKISLSDSFATGDTLELNEPCEQQEPLSGKTVLDNFDGPNNQVLGDHISDSGHAYVEGHAFAPRPFSGLGLKPFILNGNSMLQTPAGRELRDTRQLVFTPRTNSYEIGCCFRKSSVSRPENYLSFYWRDTTLAPVRIGSGTRAKYRIRGKRYELFLGNNGYAQLQKRVGNTVTVLDTTTAAFAEDSNNFLQIIQDGADITININAVPVLTATDVAITETGTISLNASSRNSSAGFAKGYWSLNWLYVDDSYDSFPIANKELVFVERLTAKENFVLEKPDFDTGRFVQIPDAAAFLEAIEPPMIEEPTTKSIEIGETAHLTDFFYKEIDSGCWYDEDWGFRKKITIDHTKVPNTDLTDFPMLVLLATDAELAANAQADGDDILFTDSTGIVKLKHELVVYTTATGYLEAWVKIPALSHTTDTVIYMYYGNSMASAQQDPTNVWDSHYRAVYHLEGAYNATTGEVLDSTGNNFDGEATASNAPAQVDGKVGKGQDFEESTLEEIQFDAANTMIGTGAKTIGPTPTFVAKGTASASAGTSLTPTYPAGMQQGDLLICVIASSDPAGGSNNSVTPLASPWVQKHALEGSDTDGQLEIWYRYVPAAGLSGTLRITVATPDANAVMQAQFYAYRGCHPTSPFEGGALTSGNGTTVTMPSITTTDINRLAVAFSANGADNAIAAPTGESNGDWTESASEDRTTTGNDVTQDAFQAPLASATTISGGTFTITSSGWAVRGFALIPKNIYSLTFEIWFKQEDTTTPVSQRRVWLAPGTVATNMQIQSRSDGNFVVATHDGQAFNTVRNIETILTLGTAYHYLAIQRSSGATIARLDGVEKVNQAELIHDFHASNPIQISQASPNLAWDGIIDEFRISDVVRSNDWLDTCYNNQNSPSTFYALGSAQDKNVCLTKRIGLFEAILALDIPELSGDRGIELSETAHINELGGVSGNQINKILTIAEFMSAEDTPLSSMEIDLSDSFSASEVISRVFEFLEFAQHGETINLSALLSVIDTGNINDNIAVRLLLNLSDTANISEIIKRLLALNESATLTDLINTMRTLPGTQDTARAADRIQITRSSIATYAAPEKTYHARELKTLFFVEKGKKVN